MSNTLISATVPSPFNRQRLTVASLGISDAAIARAYTNPQKSARVDAVAAPKSRT
jgi:hypothetical protein